MSLLENLIKLTEKSNDLSRLPNDVMAEIKANIRKGAEDLSQKWGNALSLVHKAYEVAGVERPDPTMEAAWEQYEENIKYAVHQLAKNRGIDGDWRMSSAIFHESLNSDRTFRVTVDDDTYITEGDSLDSVATYLADSFTDLDVSIVRDNNSRILSLSKWGVKHKSKIVIESI